MQTHKNQKILFLVLFLTSAVFAGVQQKEELLDDGTRGFRILVEGQISVLADQHANEKCEPWQFPSNGICYDCFKHDVQCNSSVQCCEANMACWRYGYNAPMCKCNPDYAWDGDNGVCYHAPVPAVLLVTAYTAVAAAIIVGCTAIMFHICNSIARKCKRWRHQRRIRNSRPPPRPRSLSSMVPQLPAAPLPDKPPSYEDVYKIPTISQTLRQPTGSIRSLPPAYSLYGDTTEVNAPEVTQPEINQSEVPEMTNNQPRMEESEMTQSEATEANNFSEEQVIILVRTGPTVSQEQQGIVNISFVPENNAEHHV